MDRTPSPRTPSPSQALESIRALLNHFQYYTHLQDVDLLQNKEYYDGLRDLIWINRMETKELGNTLHEFKEHLRHADDRAKERLVRLESQIVVGFAALQEQMSNLQEHNNHVHQESTTSNQSFDDDFSNSQLNRFRMVRDGLVEFPTMHLDEDVDFVV